MGFPIDQLTRHARRAQFSVVGEERAPAQPDTGRDGNAAAAKPSHAQSEPRVPRETEYSRLFREMIEKLSLLVDSAGTVERIEFFHAMKLMQNFGLNSSDVTRVLDYGQENVCRWMNGTRCPHPEMRRHVLRTCLQILRTKLGFPAPAVAVGDRRRRQP